MAVVVVVLGVGVCTVTDVKVNAKGFLCACIAVLSTFLQHIVSVYLLTEVLVIGEFSIPDYYEAFWKELDGVKQIWKNRKQIWKNRKELK
ncbi:uncharacterized protein A4U43_C05F18150 [Asparagus officinalis]|uniref:Uncharacterized protein n=1 Tax=Asparagus officinalis TaxID=4686 RepID=A0A5P1ESK7_ASPOF|nr:uncharacterized protein A4U43_C05F18150 [Asparagus officinalis]